MEHMKRRRFLVQLSKPIPIVWYVFVKLLAFGTIQYKFQIGTQKSFAQSELVYNQNKTNLQRV